MQPALLLFDIDGTLLLVSGAGRRAMNAAAARLFGEHFTFDHLDFAGRLDPSVFAEAARHHSLVEHHLHHDRFRDAYVSELQEVLSAGAAVEVMPGIPQLLSLLRRRAAERGDLLLGLLTGNYAASARLKLAAAALDPDDFAITVFGDEADTREGLVEVAMAKHRAVTGVPPARERVIVIGDTPHDVACANAHGCIAFAVATGRHTVDELRVAGAHTVVHSLDDPSPLLALLDDPG